MPYGMYIAKGVVFLHCMNIILLGDNRMIIYCSLVQTLSRREGIDQSNWIWCFTGEASKHRQTAVKQRK